MWFEVDDCGSVAINVVPFADNLVFDGRIVAFNSVEKRPIIAVRTPDNCSSSHVGLKSLNDPIDTTSAQGKLVFNIFASLAEFERDLIAERTQAGLQAARARGRKGGRPKGLSDDGKLKAIAAETLYKEGNLSVSAIAANLAISKATLYNYLRHRGVDIGSSAKTTANVDRT